MAHGPAAARGWHRPLVALRVIHPFPTLANVAAVLLFATVAQKGLPPAGVIVRLALVMFGAQSAIGAANDAVDADLDQLSKPYKPIVAGAISRPSAVAVAVVAILASSAVAATFGPAAWLLAMAGLACGLSYDAGLKRSRFSVVPYLIALPLLPVWVWTALGRFTTSLLWVYPFGILIGVALYFGNTAPDIAADLAGGVKGTAHRLGVKRSLYVAWASLALALLAAPPIAWVAGYGMRVVVPATMAAALCLAIAVIVSRRSSAARALQLAWALMVAASLLFALGWLAGAP